MLAAIRHAGCIPSAPGARTHLPNQNPACQPIGQSAGLQPGLRDDARALCASSSVDCDWNGFRDLHIEPDWLLLYRIEGDELQLAGTGTHSDLFDE
jgi:hypothetical protein